MHGMVGVDVGEYNLKQIKREGAVMSNVANIACASLPSLVLSRVHRKSLD